MENGVGPEFHPLYTVKVPNASKNGENVEFFVESTLIEEDESHGSMVVIRLHEDFAWFLHCLQTQDNVLGVIFPPLPPRPATSLQAAERRTKKQLGLQSGFLIGDDLNDYCHAYQKFLELCINHPRLGGSGVLKKFLREKEAAVRIRVRSNFFGSLKKSVDDIRLSNVKDPDSDLQQARVLNEENVKQMNKAAGLFQKVTDKTLRIGNEYSEIQTETKQLAALSDKRKRVDTMGELCKYMEEASSKASQLTTTTGNNFKFTLGNNCQLYAGFANSQHSMLQKRAQKMAELENIKRTFERAKGSKRVQAEKDLYRVRQQLDDMTTMAKPELERYNRQRVRTWQEVLVKMAETEIKNSRDAVAALTKACADLQQVEL